MSAEGAVAQIVFNRLAHHTIGLFCRHAPTRSDDGPHEDYITD